MQKNVKLGLVASLAALFSAGLYWGTQPEKETTTYLSAAGFDQNEKARKEYNDFIHRAAPDVDWKAVNSENFKQLRKTNSPTLKGENFTFLNGKLEGNWNERGANNQSGDVREIDIDTRTDSLYIMSTSGHIWKGHLNGDGWHPLNDQYVHNTDVLRIVEMPNHNRILVGGTGNEGASLFYSDDEGKTFQKAQGIDINNAGSIVLEVTEDETVFALVHDANTATVSLFVSTDNASNFTSMWSETGASSQSTDLDHIPGDNQVWMFCGANGKTYTATKDGVTEVGSNVRKGSPSLITVSYATGGTTVYWLKGSVLYKSEDTGNSWETIGSIPATYRGKIQADLTTPGKMYLGEVELHISLDDGDNWNQYSNWYAFYQDDRFPHADLMKFEILKDSQGNNAHFILNHSGIHYGDETFEDLTYLNREGLNICTYYDFTSFDEPGGFLFCGAQDKGYHGIEDDGTSIQNHDFLVTGDYFEMAITGQNTANPAIIREYPYGSFSVHFNPTSPHDGPKWETPGDDKQTWVVPTAPFVDPNENGVWVGGGNISGGAGSYLQKVSFPFGQQQADIEQKPVNFRSMALAASNISAIGQSPVNTNRLYVMTGDGSFFISNDEGETFERTDNFQGPGNEFLYGGEIEVSKKHLNEVYVAGSGYSNPGVYRSVDGGETFQDFSDGLPATFVHELELDSSEQYLFAATDAGPYVCNVLDGTWENMVGDAPIQSYRAIQYMPNLNKVRFATYGRGIWDFDIESISIGITENEVAKKELKVFPNPVAAGAEIHVEAGADIQKAQLVQLNGQEVQSWVTNEALVLRASISPGVYLLQVNLEDGTVQTQKIKIVE